jgi:flagellar hook-associated protein FlgK
MISKKRVELIVHEYLDIRKLCAKMVPRVLTIDRNQQRVDDLDFGAMFSDIRRNKDEFFRRYITKDVTWRQSPIDSQASGLSAINRIQSTERHKNCIQKLFDHFNRCIALERNYIE